MFYDIVKESNEWISSKLEEFGYPFKFEEGKLKSLKKAKWLEKDDRIYYGQL